MLQQGTDLADLYRDRLSLRQVWVRIKALPPDNPLAREIAAQAERDEADRKVSLLDEVHNRYL